VKYIKARPIDIKETATTSRHNKDDISVIGKYAVTRAIYFNLLSLNLKLYFDINKIFIEINKLKKEFIGDIVNT
jgi:hypothetical protein